MYMMYSCTYLIFKTFLSIQNICTVMKEIVPGFHIIFENIVIMIKRFISVKINKSICISVQYLLNDILGANMENGIFF